jgi:hypothetical protein
MRVLYLYLFLLGIFFFGLRYGFFNSIHSFVGSTQLDFKTRAPLYFAVVGLVVWRHPPFGAHLGVSVLLCLGGWCVLAFL